MIMKEIYVSVLILSTFKCYIYDNDMKVYIAKSRWLFLLVLEILI